MSRFLLALGAAVALIAGAPVGAEAYDDVRKIKVKDHKAKVKMVDGKAKIKIKRNGKRKVKIKGCQGEIAAAIARKALAERHGHCEKPAPRYGK